MKAEVGRMTMSEMAQEANRRTERRNKGLPLHETGPERNERIHEEDFRAEKAIQAECVKLFKAYGCQVYSLSQPRETKQTPGIADLWVVSRRRGRAFWFETKTPAGKQSDAQEEFELDCLSTNTRYVVGGIKAAEEELIRMDLAERLPSGALEPVKRLLN